MRLDITGVPGIARGGASAGDGPPPVPATIGPVAAAVSGWPVPALEIPTGAELAAIGGRGFAAGAVEALWPRDG